MNFNLVNNKQKCLTLFIETIVNVLHRFVIQNMTAKQIWALEKYAPANRVDPEDKDENKNDRLLVLDKPNIVVDHNWWLALQNGGRVGDARVLELQNLEQLFWGKLH